MRSHLMYDAKVILYEVFLVLAKTRLIQEQVLRAVLK